MSRKYPRSSEIFSKLTRKDAFSENFVSFETANLCSNLILDLNDRLSNSSFTNCSYIALDTLFDHFNIDSGFLLSDNNLIYKKKENACKKILNMNEEIKSFADRIFDMNKEEFSFFNDVAEFIDYQIPLGLSGKNCLFYNTENMILFLCDIEKTEFKLLSRYYTFILKPFMKTLVSFLISEKQAMDDDIEIDEKLKVINISESYRELLDLEEDAKIVGRRFYHLLSSPSKKKIFLKYIKNENQEKLILKTKKDHKLTLRKRQQKYHYTLEKHEKHTKNTTNIDFMAHVSHEIRTPLNGIISILPLLSETMLNPEQLNYVEIIRQSSFSLVTLINDMLDMAKLNQHKMTLREEEMSLLECINNSFLIIEGKAREKKLFLTKEIDDNLPDIIYGDPGRIRQIIINLLGNAVKFTPKGSVHLSVVCTKIENDMHFSISVKDTGIGVAPEHQKLIFKSYRQVDETNTREFEGTGLGLSISRKLARIMPHGDLAVTSEKDKGSIFTFKFSSPMVDSSLLFCDYKDRVNGLNALVVDDKLENRMIIYKFFEKWNINAVAIGSAQEVEQAYLNKLEEFDFIIIDLMMPGIDGITLGKTIRERNKKIPLILSSSGNSCPEEKIFVGCLRKPISEKNLFSLILLAIGVKDTRLKMALAKKSMDKSSTLAISRFHPKTKKILIAEDFPTNQKVIESLLKKLGYTSITIVNNGDEMVKACMNPQVRYDMILLDMKMPVKDGFQASKELTEIYRANHIDRPKILAVTAMGSSKKLFSWIDAGYLDDIVHKPIDISILKEKMEKYIGEKRHRETSSNAF